MTIKPSLTIDDIARELGVSKTTVSRAISGKGRISAATRERVQAYIEEHNYKPNASAKSLAESKTYNLALALPREFIKLDIPFVRQSMSAIVDEAYTLGYNVMLCLDDNTESTALSRILDYRKVDGVILTRTVEDDHLVEMLRSLSRTAVLPFFVTSSQLMKVVLSASKPFWRASNRFWV